MDFSLLIDIFLNLDKHLVNIVDQWGPWVYVLLFAIIFIETGVVVCHSCQATLCYLWLGRLQQWAV